MFKLWTLLVLFIFVLVRTCRGSAWLQDPPSRSAAWYYQIKTPVNYDFRNINCGGIPVKIYADGSRNCGLCGDPYSDPIPRPNELGGKYANPRVLTRYYESGQVAHISIWNNLPGAPGFYEFRLCDEDWNQSQACLDKHLLVIENTNSTKMPVPKTQGLVMIHLKLPAGVKCDKCLLQWRFRKEDIAGCDDNQWCGVGRGAQTEYYNCADVMIGAVGQPKPTYIQDPIYNAADYGSAYDIATIRITPESSNLIGDTTTLTFTTTAATTTTTTKATTKAPIVTIPIVFPVTTTKQPVTTGNGVVIIKPVTTSAPVTTTNAPITTSQSNLIGPPPITERLVVDAAGNPVFAQTVVVGGDGGGSSSSNNRQLLLLGLLPLVGALGLQAARSPGIPPVAHVPQVVPAAPVAWASTLPIYPIPFADSVGFGNFQTGGIGTLQTNAYTGNSGTYGNKMGTYGSRSYSNTYSGLQSPSLSSVNNFQTALPAGNLVNSFSQGSLQNNLINTQFQQPLYYNENSLNFNNGGFNNAGVLNNGGGQFVQNPVIWNTNSLGINNNLNSHVFPRSASVLSGASYNHNRADYSSPALLPSISNTYQSNYNTGYQPRESFIPQKTGVQNVNQWPSNGPTPNWQNNIDSNANTFWSNNGGSIMGSNINAVGEGQRLPFPQSVPQPTLNFQTPTTLQDNSFNLPGLESAARFQTNDPRERFGLVKPQSNGNMIQNGGGSFTMLTSLNPVVDNVASRGKGTMHVQDWYNMLMKRIPGAADSRAL